MALVRGDVVACDLGNTFVVWGVTGPCAHLIPLSPLAPHARASRVSVFPLMREGDACLKLWANSEQRAHRPAAEMHLLGSISGEDVAALLGAVDGQRLAARDLVATRRRRHIMQAARQARARAAARQAAAAAA